MLPFITVGQLFLIYSVQYVALLSAAVELLLLLLQAAPLCSCSPAYCCCYSAAATAVAAAAADAEVGCLAAAPSAAGCTSCSAASAAPSCSAAAATAAACSAAAVDPGEDNSMLCISAISQARTCNHTIGTYQPTTVPARQDLINQARPGQDSCNVIAPCYRGQILILLKAVCHTVISRPRGEGREEGAVSTKSDTIGDINFD